jgi:hypothetical protein
VAAYGIFSSSGFSKKILRGLATATAHSNRIRAGHGVKRHTTQQKTQIKHMGLQKIGTKIVSDR